MSMDLIHSYHEFTVNVNRALDVFIDSIEKDGIIDESIANELRKLQIVVVTHRSFVRRIIDVLFGKKDKEPDDSSGHFAVVKVLNYKSVPDNPDNEDANDFLKRKGIL